MTRTCHRSQLLEPLPFTPRLSLDICRLAGLLEGEGCFRNDKRNNISIALQMCDEDVVRWAARILRFPRSLGIIKFDNPKYRDQYKIVVQGNAAAQWMMTLYGLMGVRRKAKIKECIERWQASKWQIKYRMLCQKGHRYDGQYIGKTGRDAGKLITVCRQCVKERMRQCRMRKALAG